MSRNIDTTMSPTCFVRSYLCGGFRCSRFLVDGFVCVVFRPRLIFLGFDWGFGGVPFEYYCSPNIKHSLPTKLHKILRRELTHAGV